PPLRHDDVGTGSGGCSSLPGGTDGDEHKRARIAGLADDAARVTPEERDDAHTCCERRCQTLTLVPLEAKIDAERTLCQLTCFVDDRGDLVRRGPRQGQNPKSA